MISGATVSYLARLFIGAKLAPGFNYKDFMRPLASLIKISGIDASGRSANLVGDRLAVIIFLQRQIWTRTRLYLLGQQGKRGKLEKKEDMQGAEIR